MRTPFKENYEKNRDLSPLHTCNLLCVRLKEGDVVIWVRRLASRWSWKEVTRPERPWGLTTWWSSWTSGCLQGEGTPILGLNGRSDERCPVPHGNEESSSS